MWFGEQNVYCVWPCGEKLYLLFQLMVSYQHCGKLVLSADPLTDRDSRLRRLK